MDTGALKKFAQAARNLLIDQVTSKLDLVLAEGAPARREHPQAVKYLENAIRRDGRSQVIEQVAYTWFNRFTALRFMDANGYTQVRVVSPADGATRPEILTEALAGNIPEGAPSDIAALLDGRIPSNDPQGEAYRLLLVHACNGWHKHMPFLFEKIDDYVDHVILLNADSGRTGFPSEIVDDPLLTLVSPEDEAFQNAEERRVMYVAMNPVRIGLPSASIVRSINPKAAFRRALQRRQ